MTPASRVQAAISARAMRLWRGAIVIDMHNDLPTRIIDDRYDPDLRHRPGFGKERGSTDLPRLLDQILSQRPLLPRITRNRQHIVQQRNFGRHCRYCTRLFCLSPRQI